MKHQLIENDCESWLKEQTTVYDCIFLDPPDNIGLKYNGYVDKRNDYIEWLSNIVVLALHRSRVVWVSFWPAHHVDLLVGIYGSCSVAQFRQYIWKYNFGQYREDDNPHGYRPIWRLSLYHQWRPLMVERVPSVREQMGDLRSTGKGRVPDDVWVYSRVSGNNDERRAWHPTQHPEAIYRRIAKQSVGEGGTFVDLFAGTGTAFRALFDYNVIGVESDPVYCSEIRKEHDI